MEISRINSLTHATIGGLGTRLGMSHDHVQPPVEVVHTKKLDNQTKCYLLRHVIFWLVHCTDPAEESTHAPR